MRFAGGKCRIGEAGIRVDPPPEVVRGGTTTRTFGPALLLFVDHSFYSHYFTVSQPVAGEWLRGADFVGDGAAKVRCVSIGELLV